jgi:hypothetical protein
MFEAFSDVTRIEVRVTTFIEFNRTQFLRRFYGQVFCGITVSRSDEWASRVKDGGAIKTTVNE